MFKLILVLEICFLNLILTKPIFESDILENRSLYQDDVIDLTMIGDAIFGEPNIEAGKLVENWDPSSGVNADELGPYFGGDMLIPSPMGRNGITDVTKRWPSGVVPFVISGNFNAFGMDMIEKAINAYHKYTCIRFVPRTNQQDYLIITSESTGCWSAVGKTGGEQKLNLQSPGCVTKQGTPMHEMMHALGFLHEQNRYERDDFVTIKYENIKPETRNNFFKADPKKTNAFGIGYDFLSVMHYSNTSFSANGQPTIVPKAPVQILGQRDGFSRGDIEKINLMYNCQSSAGLGTLNLGQYPGSWSQFPYGNNGIEYNQGRPSYHNYPQYNYPGYYHSGGNHYGQFYSNIDYDTEFNNETNSSVDYNHVGDEEEYINLKNLFLTHNKKTEPHDDN